MSFTSVQEESVNNMLEFTYKLLKTTRPFLKDEEIKIVAEDMVFRAGVKACNTNQDVFKFGDKLTVGDKGSKKKRATLVQRNTGEKKEIDKEKTKNRFSFFNSTPKEHRISLNLTTDRKRVYSAAKLNESTTKSQASLNSSIGENDNSHTKNKNNVFERLYSLRRKPSEKNLEIVQKVREEEKAMKAAKSEPEIKKKKVLDGSITDDEKISYAANLSVVKNLSRCSINEKQSFNRHDNHRQSINEKRSLVRQSLVFPKPQLPKGPICQNGSSSSSTISTTSDYHSGDLMDETNFNQDMIIMNKKLDRLSVRYQKDLSLCQIDIDLV